MPVSVTMPRLGESVTEGTITRWLKQEGDRVEADEPLLEVSTDKVDTEIPAPAAGVLSRIVVHEDETAEVGSELAVIAGEGESADSGGDAPAQQRQEAQAEDSEREQDAQQQGGQQDARVQEAREQAGRQDAAPAEDSASEQGGGPSTATGAGDTEAGGGSS